MLKKFLTSTASSAVSAFAAMAASAREKQAIDSGEPVERVPVEGHYQAPPRRPANVGADGRVWRHPGVPLESTQAKMIEVPVVDVESGELTTAKVQMRSNFKAGRGTYPVVIRRAARLDVFNAMKSDIRRRSEGRFVGPFPTGAAA